MGNRLKYRLWSTEQKKMYDWYDCTKKGPNFIYGMFIDHRMLGKGCWCIQQCTGLRDKNGKLIFEGDILRVTGSRDTSGYGVVEYLQCGCKFIVTGYLDNPSGYYPRKKGELCRDLEEWLCTEVIGNIYQNLELLEVNNDTK